MKEIKLTLSDDLDSAVKKLLAAKARGESSFIKFQDVMLYSDSVTIDSAYMAVLGKTKAEYDKERAELKKRYKREHEDLKKSK